MMAAEEEDSMMSSSSESEEEVVASSSGKWNFDCIVRHCACYWRRWGSPRTPRVAPGKDYSCIPAGADHTPTWSLLVGFMQGSVLRLKRLRVARSGRILGRSDDALDFFRDVDMPAGCHFSASAALDPDDRSLCLLRQAWKKKPQALRLSLLPQTTDAQELPELPEFGATSRCILISAAGNTWALSAATGKLGYDFTVLMRLLVPGHGWHKIGRPFTSPCVRDLERSVPGRWFLKGYADLADANLILVSFKQKGLFLTFTPDSGDWAQVRTDETRTREYVPIPGRGVYVQQDQAVYVLHENTIYAYRLDYQQDDQGRRRQLGRLDPPIEIDSVCPFNSCKGYGLLAGLDGRLMCSVWISLPWLEPCRCGNLHVIVTTFHIHDPAQQGGIQVLHSSFRRINMQPNPLNQEFCFLLEFEDEDSTLLLRHEEEEDDLTGSQHVDDPSKMLDCCRHNLTQENELRMCFLCGVDGHIARDCSLPPQEPSSAMTRSMPVDPALMQHQVSFSSRPVAPLKPATTTIKQKMFIICQIGSRSFVYKMGIMGERLQLEGDNGEPLVPLWAADDGDDTWHFIHSGSKLEAVSSTTDGMLEFRLDDETTSKKPVRRPTAADPFVTVIRVGREIIALTKTLQVFHQSPFSYGPPSWLCYKTDDLHVLRRKVVIFGYVALDDHSFIVWDAVTCSCLLFDLGTKQWRVVMPWAAFEDKLPRASLTDSIFNGRCVSVDGYIYTCSDGGLLAYQLLRKDHSVYLSKPIFLKFSWLEDCQSDNVCLDYAGKDVGSGAILFYVVQAGHSRTEHVDLEITIVQVKTKRRPSKKMKPVGVDLVDRITRPIRHKQGSFCTGCCFAF